MDAVLPSSTNCAKYYDCKRHGNIPLECPYPSLFSQTTHKCEDFSNVYCGSRKEPVAPCEYSYKIFGINEKKTHQIHCHCIGHSYEIISNPIPKNISGRRICQNNNNKTLKITLNCP